jgi:gas vesicle protein
MKIENNLKVIVALAAGVLAGTALGFLLAPAKGSDTRKRVLNDVKDIAGKLKKKTHDEGVEVSEKLETLK